MQLYIILHITWISWMMNLNWGDRSVHVFTNSIALSKFFTYSPYILRKGANFCRISPILGVVVLQSKRVESQSRQKRRKSHMVIKKFQAFNRESFCLESPCVVSTQLSKRNWINMERASAFSLVMYEHYRLNETLKEKSYLQWKAWKSFVTKHNLNSFTCSSSEVLYHLLLLWTYFTLSKNLWFCSRTKFIL